MHAFVGTTVSGEPQPSQAEIDAHLAAEAARAPSVAEVARLIETVPLPAGGPDSATLAAALQRSVDAAMYWQPPAGEDVLAARPELDAGLARIATWAAPAAPGWWSAPLAPEQWSIGWWGHDPREAKQSLSRWREETLAHEARCATERRENRVEGAGDGYGWSATPGLQPADIDAPISGFWWSHPDGVSSTRAVDDIPVGLWLTEDADPEGVTVAQVQVPQNPRVLEIDTPQAWADLCHAHPLDITASRRHDWYRATGRDGDWLIPDWAAVAEEYDAVHLTVAAYLAGATRAIGVDGRFATMIAGWGPDATVWLTAVCQQVPVPWDYDRGTHRWSRSS